MRTTSSKKVSTREKLRLAAEKRVEIFSSNESLREYERSSSLSLKLKSEYDEILKLLDRD